MYENKIKEVKERADIVQVANYFNLNLNRSLKCKCPFHNEKTASFSISSKKQIFKCFGCGVGGDCIDLVAKLLHINNYESAKQINNIFNLGVDFGKKINKKEVEKYQKKHELEQKFKLKMEYIYTVLCDYYKMLREFMEINDINDKRLIEACQNMSRIEAYIDYLNNADEHEQYIFYKRQKRVVIKIEQRLGYRIV